MTTSSTQERAQSAASTATDESGHVAGVAKGEAAAVASEAAEHARNLMSEAVTQVTGTLDDQSRTQRDRLVGTLQSFGDDLQKLASGNEAPGLAADLVRDVSQRARTLGSHLEGREPSELLGDVRSFAQRRPGTFLLGALAAGVLAGRVVRGAKDSPSDPSGQAGTPSQPTGYDTAYSAGLDSGYAGTSSFATNGAVSPDPVATPGESAIPPATTVFGTDDAVLGDAAAPMGTDAAGYGERPGDEGRAL